MPDGTRRRRHQGPPARRLWYARYRALRFRRRFSPSTVPAEPLPALRSVQLQLIEELHAFHHLGHIVEIVV